MPIASGTILTTDTTGYDTLWATGSWEETADRTYSLSIPGSSKTMLLTYEEGSSTIRVRLKKGMMGVKDRPRLDILGRKRSGGCPILNPHSPGTLPKN